jgi:hypothetical protein
MQQILDHDPGLPPVTSGRHGPHRHQLGDLAQARRVGRDRTPS